jgi:hypothetical protein
MGRILLSAAAPAFAALAVSPAAGQHTIAKTEVRTAPPARTHQRLRDVVWDMFEVGDMRRKNRPVAPLSDLWLETKLRGTQVPGLCRYDSVIVELAPDAPGPHDAATPVHAVGLRASSHFAFLSPPTRPFAKAADYSRVPSDTDCAALKRTSDRFFSADGAEPAYEGYRAWRTLRQAIERKRPVPLECDLFPGEKDCSAVILALGLDDVGSVEICEAGAGQSCYLVEVAMRRIRIVLPMDGDDPKIVSAKLDSMIIIADERVD